MIRLALAIALLGVVAGVAEVSSASQAMPSAACEITGHITNIAPGKVPAAFGTEIDVSTVTLRMDTRKPFRVQPQGVTPAQAAQVCSQPGAPVEATLRSCAVLPEHWKNTPIWGVVRMGCLDAVLNIAGDADSTNTNTQKD